jgi:hypothetical protein
VVEVPVQPLGSVHWYDDAPVTGVTLYVWELFAHADVAPVIAVGAAGALPGTTVKVRGIEVPQLLVAITEMVPLLVPAAVVTMLFVVELPVHPVGNVHV